MGKEEGGGKENGRRMGDGEATECDCELEAEAEVSEGGGLSESIRASGWFARGEGGYGSYG